MAREQVFQTLDLMRHICSFGYPEFKQNMEKVFYELIYERHSMNHVLKQFPYTKEHLKPSTIFWYNMKDLLELFFALKECRCCTRHSHNKPNIQLEIVHGRTRVVFCRKPLHKGLPECVNLHNCLCQCRSRARSLSKQIEYDTSFKRTDLGCIGSKN
jgi:hypothetical protein